MYKVDDLIKYPYFKDLLQKNKIEYVLDPLSGVVNRKYIAEFVMDIFAKKIPFRLAILDLDDFKLINDKYGHLVGDNVLEGLGNDLINYVGENGIAGRFGGDEFILILFDLNDYDKAHKFFSDMIHNDRVLRKHYINDDIDIFLTGTIGSASYPENAKNMEELFLMADKTLYRGKSKGRNCFIIYVHEKHKDLEIQKIHNDDEATILFNINSTFETNDSFDEKLMSIGLYIKDNLRLDKILYVNTNNELYNLDDMNCLLKNVDLSTMKFNNELHKLDFRGDVNRTALGPALEKEGIASIIINKIKIKDKSYGYIIFALKRTANIWQNSDIAILMYLGRSIALELI